MLNQLAFFRWNITVTDDSRQKYSSKAQGKKQYRKIVNESHLHVQVIKLRCLNALRFYSRMREVKNTEYPQCGVPGSLTYSNLTILTND
ncbi:hypothetical protein J6590_096756 [Homalodisca vitripennis]|nr:hypothetical protein J6590_096756 [Homalodisca vitripennis]